MLHMALVSLSYLAKMIFVIAKNGAKPRDFFTICFSRGHNKSDRPDPHACGERRMMSVNAREPVFGTHILPRLDFFDFLRLDHSCSHRILQSVERTYLFNTLRFGKRDGEFWRSGMVVSTAVLIAGVSGLVGTAAIMARLAHRFKTCDALEAETTSAWQIAEHLCREILQEVFDG